MISYNGSFRSCIAELYQQAGKYDRDKFWLHLSLIDGQLLYQYAEIDTRQNKIQTMKKHTRILSLHLLSYLRLVCGTKEAQKLKKTNYSNLFFVKERAWSYPSQTPNIYIDTA